MLARTTAAVSGIARTARRSNTLYRSSSSSLITQSTRWLSSARSLAAEATPAAQPVDQANILEEPGMGPPPRKRPVTARVFTKGTLRRQALKATLPHYIGPAEFRKIKLGGFGEPVNTKLPWELREHKPDFQMRELRAEEVDRLKADPQRYIDDFKAGDKIVVTKYVSLNDRTKFERVAGLCLARQGGTRLSASFLMRSHKLGEDYEMRFPLWSPFIAQIHRLEEGQQNFRKKMYYLREGPRSGWEVKVPSLPKPVVAPITLSRVSKESSGKVVVLQHHPMKKQLKEKRAGGIGAELAAAGGGDKKGGAAAKPAAAPKKK